MMMKVNIRRGRVATIAGAVIAALAVVLVGAQLTGSSASPAAAAAGERGWYIDSAGVPHFLPWRGETQGQASAYTWSGGKITSWYAGTLPAGLGAAMVPSPSSSSSASPSAADETAPVLSSVGSVSSSSMLLSWTRAVSPRDTTIIGYVIEVRPSTSGTWTGALTATTDDAVRSFRVLGLTPATAYAIRVIARYGSGETGPASNVVTGTTLPAAASSSTS